MSVYENVFASLLKYCGDFIEKKNIDNCENFDFDSHGSINQLPDSDLIGIAEYSLVEAQGLYYATCAIVVCTRSDDSQLKRMRKIVDAFSGELKVGFEGIKLVSSEDAKLIGHGKVMDEIEFMPPAKQADSRPVLLINLEVGCTFLVPP